MKKILTMTGLLLSALWVQAQNVNLTFRVDMSNQTVSPNGVHVAGSWQAAAGYPGDWQPGASQMTDPDNNGIYELTVSVPEGTYQFKYINGNNWGFDESVPGECNVSGNREIVVGPAGATTTAFCYGTCNICLPTTDVTFRVGMNNVTPNPSGVSIAGSFQGWSPGQIFLTDPDNDQVFEVTVAIQPGTYQFKFLNGTSWGFDESVPGACAVSNNREFTVGSEPITVQYCYAQCSTTCNPDPTAAAITFVVDMSQQVISPDGVFVMGSFTSPQWQSGAIEMDDLGNGIYSTTILVSGAADFQYKFANGDPFTSEETGNFIEGGCGVDNGFGGSNRTHTRSGQPETFAAVCFNSCIACETVVCDVAGGTISTDSPRTNLCVGDGVANVVALQVAGNIGSGRFGLVRQSDLEVIAINATGNFNMEQFPVGNYFVGHISVPDLTAIAGITNVSQLTGCYDLSNQLPVTSVAVNGGTISTTNATSGCLDNISFSVTGQEGTTFRWALLNSNATTVLDQNTTGVFNLSSLPDGTYRVAHVASRGVNLGTVVPPNLPACTDASNIIILTKACPAGIASSPNPTTGTSWATFSVSQDEVATLEVYDMSGRKVAELFRQEAQANVDYRVEFNGIGLPNGVYVYRLTTDSEIFVEKFMIAK